MNQNYVICRPKEFEQKIQQIKQDGPQQLHVVTDFDGTITYGMMNGKRVLGTGIHLRNLESLAKKAPEKHRAIEDHFVKLMQSKNETIEVKSKLSIEWGQKNREFFKEAGLTPAHILEVIQQDCIPYREGLLPFFEMLEGGKNSCFDFFSRKRKPYSRVHSIKKITIANRSHYCEFFGF